MKYFNFSQIYLVNIVVCKIIYVEHVTRGCRNRLTSPRIGFIQNFNSRDSVRILIFFCDKSLSIMISIHCRHPLSFPKDRRNRSSDIWLFIIYKILRFHLKWL